MVDVRAKQLVTGFKQVSLVPDEQVIMCTIWSSAMEENNGITTIPFFRVLNSLPNDQLITVVPEGETTLSGYENAQIIFGDTKVPGTWMYSVFDISEGENNKIATGFIEWLKDRKKIGVVVNTYDNRSETNKQKAIYLDTTKIKLIVK